MRSTASTLCIALLGAAALVACGERTEAPGAPPVPSPDAPASVPAPAPAPSIPAPATPPAAPAPSTDPQSGTPSSGAETQAPGPGDGEGTAAATPPAEEKKP